MEIACFCPAGESLDLAPPWRPAAPARAGPSFVRSRDIARSNSAKLPSICIIMRPAGVVVSIASVRLLKPAPASSSFLKMSDYVRPQYCHPTVQYANTIVLPPAAIMPHRGIKRARIGPQQRQMGGWRGPGVYGLIFSRCRFTASRFVWKPDRLSRSLSDLLQAVTLSGRFIGFLW